MSAPVLGKMPQAARYPGLAEHQRMACLALAGRSEELRAVSSSANGSYYLALSLAVQGKTGEAIAELHAAHAFPEPHPDAGRLGYRLLVERARQAAAARDWASVTASVNEALRVCPAGTDPGLDLAPFQSRLPMAYIGAGNRAEAARIWERQLVAEPQRSELVHALALLYYWWAHGIEKSGGALPASHWRCAIAYWCLLMELEPFWKAWADDRKRAWGFELSPQDVEEVRSGFLEKELEKRFQSRADEHKQAHSAAAAGYDELYSAVLLERVSSRWWIKALALAPPESRPAGLLALPGGAGLFRRFGLLPHIERIAREIDAIPGGAECAAHLRIYFTSGGMAEAAIHLEMLNKAEDALDLLVKLPPDERGSVEALYLRSMALECRAEGLALSRQFSTALTLWKEAHRTAGEAEIKAAARPGMLELLRALKSTICAKAASAFADEAQRLREEKIDDAIDLLEKALPLDSEGKLLEILCFTLCDTTKERTKDIARATADARRALVLQPGYARAKQKMSILLNNQGCEEEDRNRKIRFFEQSLEFEPADYQVQENLAGVLRSKAVELVNSANNYNRSTKHEEAIRLLERAFGLVNRNLKPDALSTIRSIALLGHSMIESAVASWEPEILRRIVSDLGYLYSVRSRGY